MKKLLPAIVIAIAGLATIAVPSAFAADRDCSDFTSQKEAQLFFLRNGGPNSDPHRLDSDGDGIACESLPCPCYRKTVLPPSPPTGDRNCSDFRNQRRAQFFFLRHGGPRRDRHRLDADHDGIACEELPCPCYRKRHLPRPRFHDRDCSDFANQRSAQAFYRRHGGPRKDPHRLDGDGDGIACESLPCPCSYKRRLAEPSQRPHGRAESRLESQLVSG